MKLDITEIRSPHKKDRDHQSLQSLCESMQTTGQIEPIILNKRNEIISGRRRFFAAKELKWKEIEVEYFEKSAIEQEIAQIDANLMMLPLGDVDHDQALARRKKLYDQKPQLPQKGRPKTFARDASDTIGVTSRSVELAIARAEKASPLVVTARREGKLSPTVVNALVRMPPSYQDKILPLISGKNSSEVKRYVDLAMEKDVDFAVARITKTGEKIEAIEQVEKYCDKLQNAIDRALLSKARLDPASVKTVLEKCNEIISHIEKFIEINTPVHKPILRRQQSIAS